MDGDIYYVYVLRLENNGYYIGSTKNLLQRIKKHFSIGGAIATKEIKVIEIVEILRIKDYKVGFEYAHLILEISTAIKYSNDYGANMVRGAKHGKGWDDFPTPNGVKEIKRVNHFMNTEAFRTMMGKVEKMDLFQIHCEKAKNAKGIVV